MFVPTQFHKPPFSITQSQEESAKLKFQAISFAYNYLKDPERRKDYDQEGILPDENDIGDSDENKPNDWKDYFDLIFGKLTSTKKIDDFELQYKMSLEEEADVLKYYQQFEGNLAKCLEFVMLSQDRDVKRWMEDYIQPAIDEGKVPNFEVNLKSSMTKIEKKLAKEQKKQKDSNKTNQKKPSDAKSGPKDEDIEEGEEEEEFIDDNETESEDSEEDNKRKSKKRKASKPSAKKAKPAVTKKRRQVIGGCGPSDRLIAAIRGRGNGGGGANLFASLGARYGVDMSNDDPLDDDAFEKIQSKLKNKKRGK